MTPRLRSLACLLLVAAAPMACRRQSPLPGWVQSAPPDSLFALSGSLGWMLRQPMFQSTLVKYPMAERILDTFLRQANINVEKETGRIAFFVQGDPKTLMGGQDAARAAGNAFLISLSEFRDSKALLKALAEAFPPEGSLRIGDRDYPLHVVLDLNQWHIRAMLDERGTVWLGDLQALSALARDRKLPQGVQRAASWITPGAQFQGFVHVSPMLEAVRGAATRTPGEVDWMGYLPEGIQGAAFSATPLKDRPEAMQFELLVSGTPEGIQKTIPWMQRILAVASSLQGGAGLPRPELVQEGERMALRCPLTETQVKEVVQRLTAVNPATTGRP